MASATDSSTSGGSAAVRVPRSPPLKVLAEQLRRDVEGAPGAWRLSRAAAGRAPLELAAVWMQGTMVEVGRCEARLRDPSGAFSVCGLERVPRGRPCLVPGNSRPLPAPEGGLGLGLGPGQGAKGKYVMVMGVVQACSPEPCLQAVKMTDLSDNPLHESMWELEVEDLHRNIP
ncbi:recQ-mediated genome instability protein 2 isoform X1 [Heterocephalus glaber]|uniref:RecQ-mediated genome instability protein 2 isoform X1 n=1 Tax=Heterocephalus glaber TaxID=10181 RepID=A0AAX6RTP7_HETGA|nr:recQ-mediated genome instability protein 2 isoform X1 [Heterocephalus glaber]